MEYRQRVEVQEREAQALRESRVKEREELEAERMRRLELERRTLAAEIDAERARFELERRHMRVRLCRVGA